MYKVAYLVQNISRTHHDHIRLSANAQQQHIFACMIPVCLQVWVLGIQQKNPTRLTTYHIVSIDTRVGMMFGTLMDTIFLCKLWPTYIEQFFQRTHECDLTCTLLYNDDKIEGIGTHKSEAFYQLLADLVHRKVPIVGGTVGGGRGSVGI